MRKVEGWLITIRQCLQAYTFDMTAWICIAHHCSDLGQGVYECSSRLEVLCWEVSELALFS
jgi:hypothetical protein